MLIIGAVNIDLVATTLASYIPRDSNPAKVCLSVGGVAMNYAHHLMELGEKVTFITVFADDSLGRIAFDECRRLGVDTSLCCTIPRSRANLFVGIHNPEGELESAVCDASLTEQYLNSDYLSPYLSYIHSAPLVMADTNLSASTLAWLMDYGTAPLMLDGVSVEKTKRLVQALRMASHPHIHSLKLNQSEYDMFLSLGADAFGAHIDYLLVTQGAAGVQVYHQGSVTHYPAQKVEKVVSSLGAGDAFLSGWAYGWLHHYTVSQSVDLAQRLAAAALTAVSASEEVKSV